MSQPTVLSRTHPVVEARSVTRTFQLLAGFLGIYFLATGIWPLVWIDTFQLITGPKTDHLLTGREADHWLVNTVAVLLIAVGLALLTAARRRPSLEVVVLGAASAIGLMAIDVDYVFRQVLLLIYLVDAGLQVMLLTRWLWITWRLPANSGDLRNP